MNSSSSRPSGDRNHLGSAKTVKLKSPQISATPLLKSYAAYRSQQLFWQDAIESQSRTLKKLIRTARGTVFGKNHKFEKLERVEDYQRHVPLRTYDQFWQDYIQPHFPFLDNIIWPGLIPYYAVSSGTTSGSTKYIPYTEEMSSSNTKAGLDLLAFHYKNFPNSSLGDGKSFMLGGSTSLTDHGRNVFSGDLSGISVKTIKSWVAPWYFPPKELALIENWEEKIAALAQASLSEKIKLLGGVPTWLLIFFDKLRELNPSAELLPGLEMLVHGGVPFGPYKKRFEHIFENREIDFREVYPASEAFIGIADRGYGEGLRLLCDHGNFFEFVPVEDLASPNPRRFWLGNVELGVEYALVLTTCAGLWSYIIGDTVQFVKLSPPRILVTGRTAFYLSAFGEHLIADEIEDAVNYACQETAIALQEYTVGALFPEKAGDLGQHLFIIESEESAKPEQIERFCQLADQRLCQRNEDYKAHRAEGFGLNKPALRIIPPGSFMLWMKSRGKLGGQNKIPRIVARQELFQDLIDFIKNI